MDVSFESAYASNSGGNYTADQGPNQTVDGNNGTSWVDFNSQPLMIGLSSLTRVDEFRFTTAQDCPGRDPVLWQVHATTDLVNWNRLHHQRGIYVMPGSTRPAVTEWFRFAAFTCTTTTTTTTTGTTSTTTLGPYQATRRRRFHAGRDTNGGFGTLEVLSTQSAPGSDGRPYFQKISFGACSWYGLHPVTGPAKCEEAAKELGLSDMTATSTGAASRPQGCYWYLDSQLWLGVNPLNEGLGMETSRASPMGTRHPICSSEKQGTKWAVTSVVGAAERQFLSHVVAATMALALAMLPRS